jgi:hypothetical protein
MTTTQTIKTIAAWRNMAPFTTTTLGTWKHSDGRLLTASYLDSETVRVDRNDRTSAEFSTEDEWLRLYDIIRDNGFIRAGSSDLVNARAE